MTVTFRPADAVKRIAADLIPKHHKDLVDVRIEYVFRSETANAKGKAIWGRARKISGLNAYLSQDLDPDETPVGEDVDYFVIEISEPVWAILTPPQRIALVDHELCHCRVEVTKDDEAVLKLIGHDLEEFRAVVDRHGLWEPELEAFAGCIPQQLTIDDAPDAP